MFGIGMGHMLLLAAIALIAIGPKQLPEVARVIGRFLNDMKKVRDEFTRTIVDARDSTNDQLMNQQGGHLPGQLPESQPYPAPYDSNSSAHSSSHPPYDPHQHYDPNAVVAADEHDQMTFNLAPDRALHSAPTQPELPLADHVLPPGTDAGNGKNESDT